MQLTSSKKPMTKFGTFKTEVTVLEANDLATTLHQFRESNPTLTESVARWIAKNTKKLKPIVDRTNLLNKSIFEKYVEKEGEKSIFWNYKEGDPKAIVNKNMLYSLEDGKPVPSNIAPDYKPYVSGGEERLKEFEQKRKEADEAKHPVYIEQLNIELLANVNIPSQADIVSLYDVLTFDEEEAKLNSQENTN